MIEEMKSIVSHLIAKRLIRISNHPILNKLEVENMKIFAGVWLNLTSETLLAHLFHKGLARLIRHKIKRLPLDLLP